VCKVRLFTKSCQFPLGPKHVSVFLVLKLRLEEKLQRLLPLSWFLCRILSSLYPGTHMCYLLAVVVVNSGGSSMLVFASVLFKQVSPLLYCVPFLRHQHQSPLGQKLTINFSFAQVAFGKRISCVSYLPFEQEFVSVLRARRILDRHSRT